MTTTCTSPLGALARGIAAGVVASYAQTLFFAASRPIAPAPPPDAFHPPEPAQASEQPTETVARRVVEDLFARGPLRNKARAGRLVHYAFGAAWGGAYGALAGSWPPARTIGGGMLFGVGVWCASDNLILPAARLAAWPTRYPATSHAYAVAAHLVYGAALSAAFGATAPGGMKTLAAALGTAWLRRRAPAPVRSAARRVAAAVQQRGRRAAGALRAAAPAWWRRAQPTSRAARRL
jgi:hypothetical protein